MEKLKVAVIGVGSISKSHIDAYRANPNVELYAFCDINEKQLKKMGEKYGITRLYTDEAEMLKALPELEAVSVCTWNSAHAPCTIMALNAGKHVLCEKPMALNVEEAEEMKAAAEKNGKLLMIGFVRRFGKDCKIVKDMNDSDTLGEVYYAKAVNLRRNGNPCGWFGEKARSGGGPLIDLGVHSIDLVRYLLGKPRVTSVYGATFHKLGNRPNVKTPKSYVSASATDHDICDCEDLATATVRFDNGSVLSIEMSFSLNVAKEENSVQLFGTKGGVKMADEVELFTETNGYLSAVSLVGKTGFNMDAFQDEIAHFVDCVRNGTSCMNPAEDGVELMRILTAIYRSAESGHEVVIAQ
ncbi:MAG: Gfo/Idh/MocA family oxidoreductase [Clostridia bacterium]|nr:Gfo/Idh/MocA family oxidoreductase [Clostridia bacterium]